ncbi:MAG: hypothetical protein LC722_00005, partial [Actinobacteria bacterium]|nr:hypothetical protein [Actinomycetota bacterium]
MAVSTAATGRSAAARRPEPARPPEPVIRAQASAPTGRPAGRLGAAGGILIAVGGLGLHLRATRTLAEGQPPT